jgi:hypothetical protein
MEHDSEKSSFVVSPERCKVIACATVIDELLAHMPPGMTYEVLDFGLHNDPDALRETLQHYIDSTESGIRTILLGYGLCSQAVVGLRSHDFTLVIPRVDDCIAIFLGSSAAYQEQCRSVPGTYYLTRGWIEAGYSPFNEYDFLVEQYGEKKARHIIGKMLKNYKRLAFINTGNHRLEHYRALSRTMAEKFDLRFEEVQGSDEMIKKFFYGPWDDGFVIIMPGRTVSFMDFRVDAAPLPGR